MKDSNGENDCIKSIPKGNVTDSNGVKDSLLKGDSNVNYAMKDSNGENDCIKSILKGNVVEDDKNHHKISDSNDKNDKKVVNNDKNVVKNAVEGFKAIKDTSDLIKSDSNGKNEIKSDSNGKDKDKSVLFGCIDSKIDRKKCVKDKIKAFEVKKIQRSNVKISPNKLRIKEVSRNIQDKMDKLKTIKDDKVKDKINKTESDKKKRLKLDLIESTVENNVKMIKMNGKPTDDVIDRNSERGGDKELKNAFKILLESRKEAKSPSNTPRRKYLRRKIGEIRSPSIDGLRNGTVRDWIKKCEKDNFKV